jgi:hypothetical protein
MAEVRLIRIDAKTFQEPLGKLAATMVEKVYREGPEHIPGPEFVKDDLTTLLRYAASVYNLLNYLNADERRKEDPYWYVRYGVTAMSLVRSLIDCLYNVIAILENPKERAIQYRKSGFKKALDELEEDRQKYGGQPAVDEYINTRRKSVVDLLRASGFTVDEILATPKHEGWPTFGQYINKEYPGGVQTEQQKFLKTFAHLQWRQYSALSHGAYEAFIGTLGHVPVGAYYVNDFLPHQVRDNIEESYHFFLSTHLGRSATVLLCIVTELQGYCRFDGANIDHRICEVWAALLPSLPTRELYDARYSALMHQRKMVAAEEEDLLQKGLSVRDVGDESAASKNSDEGSTVQGA